MSSSADVDLAALDAVDAGFEADASPEALVGAIKTALSRIPSMDEAFEKLQYPARRSTARPVRKREIFESLAKALGITIPHSKRSAVFACLDHNHDGQIDFKHDFATLYEGDAPQRTPKGETLAAREAFAVDCLCRGFQEKAQTPRSLWDGQASISFAEAIRRLQSIAPELSHHDMYPMFHRMGLDARAEGALGADAFCDYFGPKLDVFAHRPTPTRPQSAKSARSAGGVAARHRKRADVQTPRVCGPVSTNGPDSMLLGKIDDMCTFVVVMDFSPGMVQSRMISGESRAEFAVRETLSHLRRKANEGCTNKVNIVLFGESARAAKWRDRSVRLSGAAVDEIEVFLRRHLEDPSTFSAFFADSQSGDSAAKWTASSKRNHGPRVLRAILVDMLNNDTVSEVCLVCGLETAPEAAGGQELAKCALQGFKGRALVKLVRGRQPSAKLPPSPSPRLRSCVVPKSGGCAIIINVAVIGPAPDNESAALGRLARAGNGTVRWINDAGEEMCHITHEPRNKLVANHERRTDFANAAQGFWWALQKSPTADATKRILKRVILAVLKTSLPLDEAYAAFDANGDGVVSVGDFGKVVNAILLEEGQCLTKLSAKERFRLWRVFDTVDLGTVSIPRFVAVIRVAASYLGLDVDPLLANESLQIRVEEQMGIIQDALAQSAIRPSLRPRTASSRLGTKRSQYDTDGPEGDDCKGGEAQYAEDDEDEDDDDMHWLPPETDSSHATGSESAPSAMLSVSTPQTEPKPEEVDPMTWVIPPRQWRLPCLEASILRLEERLPGTARRSALDDSGNAGLQWSILEQAKVATDTISVTLAVNAAWERVRLGVADTPGLLHGRTTAYSHGDLPDNLCLAPEVLTSARCAQHLCDQAPFGDAMDSFATFHVLDMNAWLQREDRSICSTGELSLAAPILHAQTHLNGSSHPRLDPTVLRPSDMNRLRVSLLSMHGRQLARAQELVGMHLSMADEVATHRIRKVVSLPPRGADDAVRIGLELEGGKVLDANAAIRESAGVRLIVPEDCVGASDGERYVPPGVGLPLGRFWGPLHCYSVGTLQGGFGLSASATSAVTLELPSFVPFSHELDLSGGFVDVGPEHAREGVALASDEIRNLEVKRFRGICIRAGRVGPSANLLALYKLSGSNAGTQNAAANRIIGMNSIVARLNGPDGLQALWVTEVPPSWLDIDDLLATCRALWNVCRAQGAHRTASGRAELTLPQLNVHSGFVAVEGLPGARQSTSFTLDAAGCELLSCCGLAWAMVAQEAAIGAKTGPEAKVRALDPLAEEREFADGMLNEDRFIFSKPLLCFMTNGQELLSAFVAGQDGWALETAPVGAAGESAPGPRLSVRTNLRLRTHHSKLRSPTKDLPDPGSPPGTGRQRRDEGAAPKLYRIPDSATTEECMVIIAQTIAETLEATHMGSSLGQFFDALAEVCSTGTPGASSGPPKALNRKALTTGLRRTLGIKMNWSQFDAVFSLLGAGSTEVSKERFVKAFTRRIMRITDSMLETEAAASRNETEALETLKAVTRSDRQWLRETLVQLVDALENEGENPATMFPQGASAAEFVRYLTKLDSGLSKQDLYKLLGAVDTGFVRKLDSWLDFGNMLSAVYMERLRDLQVLRAMRSGVMRTRAIDLHVARIERMLRHQETCLHEAHMFRHSVPPQVLRSIRRADKLGKQLASACASYAAEHATTRTTTPPPSLESLQGLQNKAQEAEREAESLLAEFAAKVQSAPRVSDEAARIAREELRSPWLHVAFRDGLALQGAARGPFATLLRRAGVAVANDRKVYEEDREFRLERLRMMIARTEVRLAREDAAQRKIEASNAASSLAFGDRRAPRVVRIQWQPLGPTRPMSAKASPARSPRAEPTLRDGTRMLQDSSQQPQAQVFRAPKHMTVDARQISFASVRDLMMTESESDVDESGAADHDVGTESEQTLTLGGGVSSLSSKGDTLALQASLIADDPRDVESKDDAEENAEYEDDYEDDYSEAEFEDEA